jgi:hypothetical protein
LWAVRKADMSKAVGHGSSRDLLLFYLTSPERAAVLTNERFHGRFALQQWPFQRHLFRRRQGKCEQPSTVRCGHQGAVYPKELKHCGIGRPGVDRRPRHAVVCSKVYSKLSGQD